LENLVNVFALATSLKKYLFVGAVKVVRANSRGYPVTGGFIQVRDFYVG